MDKKKIILNKSTLELNNDKLKKQLQKLAADFKAVNGWQKGEQDIETSFTFELLKLLGWDKKDWIINTGQDVQTGKKPDIILKSNASKLLVIESKDASKKDKLDGSYQTKTFTEQLFGYCEAEGLYWGILTNFVEWRLYSVAQKRLYKERKYAFHDLLWENANKDSYIDLFSDEGLAFLNRLSKQNLVSKNGKIDTDTVYYPQQLDLEQDKIKKEFFSKIKNWRAKLKTWITKNYTSQYNTDEIDLMAQKILDRMIFMDICHDKGVINENHIQSVLSATKRTKFDELKEKFKLMDEKFNTELFAANEIDKIKINDDVMVEIIKELDGIDFSKLSVHIIGEVYENYLGELLRSNAKKEDTIKQKQKSKRKSQGIYYTPDYIVDYIVKNTVGELLAKVKTTAEIEKIRVLDPACGSGSFLIRVFDEFINAYRRVMKVAEGQTMWDEFIIRKKILQNNIFGVDLDAKAVEITKLNLMIKALDRIKPQDLKGNHLLPNLNLNIRCGNSLIGGEKLNKEDGKLDFDNYQKEIDELIEFKNKFNKENDNDKKKEILGEISKLEEVINKNINKGLSRYFSNLDKVNPFNYTVAFCEIFKDGGFDAVIGNPPYVRPHNIDKNTKKFLWDTFVSFKAKSDLFACFIQEGISLMKNKGLFSFIVSNTWLSLESFDELRKYILANTTIKLLSLPPKKVFQDAQVETIIFVFEKGVKKSNMIKINGVSEDDVINIREIKQEEFNKTYKNTFDLSLDEESRFKFHNVEKLEDLIEFYYGLKTADDNKFLTFEPKNSSEYKKLLRRSDFSRYSIKFDGEYVWYRPELMRKHKTTARPGEPKRFESPKIIITDIAKKIIATFDNDNYYVKDALILLKKNNSYDLKFILGVINSKLLNYIYTKTFKNLSVAKNAFLQLPIFKASVPQQKAIIKLVDEMLKLNKTPKSREKNKTQIEAVDYEIDQLVYKLYNLTPEEVKIVEGK